MNILLATKQNFLTAYKVELIARYPWASDSAKLERFMNSVSETLNGANTWNHSGEAVTAAWATIGGKGKPSKTALRTLP